MVAVIVLTTLALTISFHLGMRYNLALVQNIRASIEACFRPMAVEYTPMRQGVGFGFDYQLDGHIPTMQGIMTTLPRYTPLYLPIARLLKRGDLLKLTFHCGDTLPPGVGVLVNETRGRVFWQAVDRDPDWQEESHVARGQSFRIFTYNPMVRDRLRTIADRLISFSGFNQLSVDSRCGKITIFLTPSQKTIDKALKEVLAALFFLTADD